MAKFSILLCRLQAGSYGRGCLKLIDEAMTAAIDKKHVAIWPDLYELLSQEEKNCLFHSMQSNLIPEKRALLQYGALNNRLFFIEKGTVVVAIPQEGSEKLKVFAQLGRGDVLGEYSFATLALCSVTAVTKTPVQLRCLEGKMAESWNEKHPGLYEKVVEFCQKYGQIDQITERKEQEVHLNPRYPVQGHHLIEDAASQPIEKAAWRLKPPVSACRSSSSPTIKSPLIRLDSIVLGLTSFKLTPPDVTIASFHER